MGTGMDMDHPSEDPRFNSLLHPDPGPSSEIERFEDFVDGIRLCDTWRPGEHVGCLDGDDDNLVGVLERDWSSARTSGKT